MTFWKDCRHNELLGSHFQWHERGLQKLTLWVLEGYTSVHAHKIPASVPTFGTFLMENFEQTSDHDVYLYYIPYFIKGTGIYYLFNRLKKKISNKTLFLLRSRKGEPTRLTFCRSWSKDTMSHNQFLNCIILKFLTKMNFPLLLSELLSGTDFIYQIHSMAQFRIE